jgi:hypothetical protein
VVLRAKGDDRPMDKPLMPLLAALINQALLRARDDVTRQP